MTHTSYESFLSLAQKQKKCTIYQAVQGDILTPIQAYLALSAHYQDMTLLESSPKEPQKSRYSYLCFDVLASIAITGNTLCLCEADAAPVTKKIKNPLSELRQFQKKYNYHSNHALAGFLGGILGFMSYEAIHLFESSVPIDNSTATIPDLFLRAYRFHLNFDHQTGQVLLGMAVTCEDNLENTYQTAIHTLTEIKKLIFSGMPTHENMPTGKPSGAEKNVLSNEMQVNLSDKEFAQNVELAKKHIRAGDIFQIVLSRTFSIKLTQSAFDVYRHLRASHPAPYMFFIEWEGKAITGASPEKLVSLHGETIETCPLAGTRPRHPDPETDKKRSEDLLNDEKELAEHIMLVDLARNDLGKVAKPGSVKISKFKNIEKYSTVMHISSTVEASLQSGKDAFDAIQATFPAGTLSGAPKVKAMQLIHAIEKNRRGIYGGIIMAIDSQGDLETCIAIRTAFIQNNVAHVRVGAGLVFDSEPLSEAQETSHKARGVLESLQKASLTNAAGTTAQEKKK